MFSDPAILDACARALTVHPTTRAFGVSHNPGVLRMLLHSPAFVRQEEWESNALEAVELASRTWVQSRPVEPEPTRVEVSARVRAAIAPAVAPTGTDGTATVKDTVRGFMDETAEQMPAAETPAWDIVLSGVDPVEVILAAPPRWRSYGRLPVREVTERTQETLVVLPPYRWVAGNLAAPAGNHPHVERLVTAAVIARGIPVSETGADGPAIVIGNHRSYAAAVAAGSIKTTTALPFVCDAERIDPLRPGTIARVSLAEAELALLEYLTSFTLTMIFAREEPPFDTVLSPDTRYRLAWRLLSERGEFLNALAFADMSARTFVGRVMPFGS